jgi:PIN domain nuclease of toxin-antitoxin system
MVLWTWWGSVYGRWMGIVGTCPWGLLWLWRRIARGWVFEYGPRTTVVFLCLKSTYTALRTGSSKVFHINNIMMRNQLILLYIHVHQTVFISITSWWEISSALCTRLSNRFHINNIMMRNQLILLYVHVHQKFFISITSWWEISLYCSTYMFIKSFSYQ